MLRPNERFEESLFDVRTSASPASFEALGGTTRFPRARESIRRDHRLTTHLACCAA